MERAIQFTDKALVAVLRAFPKALYTDVVRWGAAREVPVSMRAALYRSYARATGAELSEVEYPLQAYPTFAAFFARGLKSGARPIAQGTSDIVSPADGRVSASGRITEGQLLQAKGRMYSVRELVGDEAWAAEVARGDYLTIYLSPADYHRVHAPVAGALTGYRHIAGRLWPVNDFTTNQQDGVFVSNERVVFRLMTEHGPVLVVMVAAMGVGSISLLFAGHHATGRMLSRKQPPSDYPLGSATRVKKGDQIAAFELGSTVIAMFPPGKLELAAPLVRSSKEGIFVRCGQRIGGWRTESGGAATR